MNFSWQGAKGKWYEFDVARAKRMWEPIGGVYMFVKPGDYPTMEAGGPITLYVAATHNFFDALSRHDMWAAAQQLGAAEIHLLAVPHEDDRERIMMELIEAHTPILNRPMLRQVA